MKVYVTQGHEKGIGLEVFFKACLMLPQQDLSKITLLAFKTSVGQTLKGLNISFHLNEDSIEFAGTKINVVWISGPSKSQSFSSLELGMKLAESGGVLYTLPTSKDQFPGYLGHTEFFRHFYRQKDLGMFFSAPGLQVLLLSDHVALSQVTQELTKEIIFKRLYTALNTFEKWNWPIEKILISGLNPHAGEGGLIGDEDRRIDWAIHQLPDKWRKHITGPLPGDTMLLGKTSPEDLLVYLFHDQGLGVFKGLQGFIGSNITLGLPYPRFSPDHGTSFQLYGKNQADYRGCEFSLRQAIRSLKEMLNGKNSGHQGQSP